MLAFPAEYLDLSAQVLADHHLLVGGADGVGGEVKPVVFGENRVAELPGGVYPLYAVVAVVRHDHPVAHVTTDPVRLMEFTPPCARLTHRTHKTPVVIKHQVVAGASVGDHYLIVVPRGHVVGALEVVVLGVIRAGVVLDGRLDDPHVRVDHVHRLLTGVSDYQVSQ